MQETLDRATEHLAQMTLSQRVAILLGVTLVAGSLAWMVQWAAAPEYVPLLPQALSSEEITQITTALDLQNQTHKSDGTQVYVPASADKARILALLQQSGKMPEDTSISFRKLIEQANPWLPQAENTRRWTLALQTQLSEVLRGFSGVEQASVFLNLNAAPRGFSRNQPTRTASVNLRMVGGAAVPRALAINAAKLVSGAVSGLTMANVKVTNGSGDTVVHWSDDDAGDMSDLARQQRLAEKEVTRKILGQLDYIPDVKVSVQVVLDRTARSTNSADVAEGAKTSERSYEEESNQSRPSGQPGVQPNAGVAVGQGSTRSDQASRIETSKTYAPSVAKTSQSTPAGGVTQVHAAISISHEFLVDIHRRTNPDATEPPSEAELERIFERQELRISAQVAKLVYPPNTDQIALAWHYSKLPPETATASAVDTSMDLATRFAPAGALGMLAMLSLFFMMRMAKASGNTAEAFGMEIGLPAEAIEAARNAEKDLSEAERPSPDAVGPEGVHLTAIPYGNPADDLLEAQEITDELAQVSRMLKQVSDRVEDDEEIIAALLEKWINN